MPEEAARVLLTQGVLGAVAVLEGFAIIFLFYRLDGKDKTIQNRDEVISALQEKRVEEGNLKTERVIEAIKDQTSSNTRLSEVVSGFRQFIENLALGK